MKSKYCFLRVQGQQKSPFVVYQVYVGTSQRETTKLLLIQAYCKDCGLYFKKWCTQVDDVISLMDAGLSTSGNIISHLHQTTKITIHQLYELIMDDSFDAYERNLAISQSEKWHRFRNHLDFFNHVNQSQCNTVCPPCKRQYLSLHKVSQSKQALLCAAAIIALLYLDEWISTVFGWI